MRKLIFSALLLCFGFVALAQTDTSRNVRLVSPMQLPSNDHLMLQFGGASWQDRPDSIKTKGFSRTFNVYLMMDFAFRTNPSFSIALGPGLSTDHIFLDEQRANVAGTTTDIQFVDQSDTVHFKKFKVSTAFLELPVEFRFNSNPDVSGKAFKMAIGARVGTLLSAWTKGKELQNAAGNTVNDYIEKQKSKRYFNSTRLSLIGRIGYGHFTAFTSYSLTSVFKEGVGPKMNVLSIGLTLSGL